MLKRVCSLIKMTPPARDVGLLSESGKTVPTAGTYGYAVGCIFQHTDGGAGTAFYINEGTLASCDFQAVAALTAAQEALLGATAGTATGWKAVILNADSHIDAVKTTALSLGASGSATLVTATAAQLNTLAGASAGIAAVLAGGLGGSSAILKTTAATTTVISAHATKARACLVVVVVNETYAVGTGTLPTVKVGEDDTIEKAVAATVLTNQAAGTTLVYAFTNLATKKIIVTSTAAVGNSTGGCTVTVIAIPTT